MSNSSSLGLGDLNSSDINNLLGDQEEVDNGADEEINTDDLNAYFDKNPLSQQSSHNSKKRSNPAKKTEDEPDIDCCICFEDYSEKTGASTDCCIHKFHFLCLKEWLIKSKNTTCPICRRIIDKTYKIKSGELIWEVGTYF